MSINHIPPAPRPRPSQSARSWAAAKSEYLAGAEAEAVCRRHDIRTAYFLRMAGDQGWRRPDPEPESLARAPEPAPTVQNQPLVIPDAPTGAIRDQPLTTLEMVDKCWSHVQAAIAAGQLIQARGWLRLYKELKPLVPYAEIDARKAQQAREAADRDAGEEDVALPLHGFSDPEPEPPEPEPELEPEPDPTRDLVRLTTRLAAAARQAEKAALQQDLAPPLHCFSAPESHAPPRDDDAPPDATGDEGAADSLPVKDLARLIAELQAVTARAEQTLKAETALHSFSPPESHTPAQGP